MKTINNDATLTQSLIDELKTRNTFTIANVARALGHDPRNVRARLRVARNTMDAPKNAILSTRLENAKHHWTFPIASIGAICDWIKRDDDE